MQEKAFDNIDKKLLESKGKIIHQIWYNFKNPDEEQPIPDKYKKIRDTWIINNPKWVHVVWNDIMGDWLVYKHYRYFWETYSNYRYPIQRVDAIRLCILHRYGGLYADMDAICNGSVDPLLAQVSRNVALPRGKMQGKNSKFPSNFLMYAKEPGDKFWTTAINGAIKYGNGGSLIPYHLKVFESAGPLRIYKTIKELPDSIDLFNYLLVVSYKKGEAVFHKDLIKNSIVLHEMHNTWTSPTEITSLVMKILIIILVIVVVMVMAVKKIKTTINKTPV